MNIVAERKTPIEDANGFLGKFAVDDDYDVLIEEFTSAVDENGDHLFTYIPNALSNDIARESYMPILEAAEPTDNRGVATAEDSMHNMIRKRDGKVSKTHRTKWRIFSSIIGYYDRYVRFPYCRLTAYTEHHPEKYSKILPVIRKINELYEKHSPVKYKKQKQIADDCSQDFIIGGTAFSTGTINLNYRTAYHRDAKNIEGGMCGMAVIGGGKYSGGVLVFPEYRIGVNVRSTDVIIMDNGPLIHGNTEMVGKLGDFQRLSLVMYLREGILKCGSMEEELQRAKIHGQKITKEIDAD